MVDDLLAALEKLRADGGAPREAWGAWRFTVEAIYLDALESVLAALLALAPAPAAG